MPCKVSRPPTQRFISMCMEKARSLAHPFLWTACQAAGDGSINVFKLTPTQLINC